MSVGTGILGTGNQSTCRSFTKQGPIQIVEDDMLWPITVHRHTVIRRYPATLRFKDVKLIQLLYINVLDTCEIRWVYGVWCAYFI